MTIGDPYYYRQAKRLYFEQLLNNTNYLNGQFVWIYNVPNRNIAHWNVARIQAITTSCSIKYWQLRIIYHNLNFRSRTHGECFQSKAFPISIQISEIKIKRFHPLPKLRCFVESRIASTMLCKLKLATQAYRYGSQTFGRQFTDSIRYRMTQYPTNSRDLPFQKHFRNVR